jgi:hypothetical protein
VALMGERGEWWQPDGIGESRENPQNPFQNGR